MVDYEEFYGAIEKEKEGRLRETREALSEALTLMEKRPLRHDELHEASNGYSEAYSIMRAIGIESIKTGGEYYWGLPKQVKDRITRHGVAKIVDSLMESFEEEVYRGASSETYHKRGQGWNKKKMVGD